MQYHPGRWQIGVARIVSALKRAETKSQGSFVALSVGCMSIAYALRTKPSKSSIKWG